MNKTVTIFTLFAFTIGSFSQVPENWEGKVMTVNGLIAADSMGITLPHEHLLIVHKFNYLDLTDEATAITELEHYVNAGGKTLVETSVIGIGRNPEGLKRISTATGVNVIMSAGYYKDLWIHDSLKSKSVEQLTEIIISDIINGINGIHAGLIKIAVSGPITQFEENALIAAARAQKFTGAAIEVHFDGDLATTVQKHYVLDVFESEGVDLTRVCLNHAVPYVDMVDDLITLAQRGCYLAFDMQGLEVRVAFQHELELAETFNALIGEGYLEQILISQDVCFSVCYVKNGGYGYAHILNNIVPQLKTSGITDEQINTIMVENPKRMFPFKRNLNVGQCINATYTSASGTVTDNSGTSDYLDNMSCSKLIQPSNCSSVTLAFTAFNTESGNDVISVYDGATTSSPLLGQYSGNALPPALKSTGGSMLLVFTTNESITASGWSASYYGTLDIDYTGPCVNETFTAESGTITDNSGSANYSNYMTCSKLIQPSGGGPITLTFTAFNTEAGYDFVRVYNGSTTSSPLMGTYSGTTLPPALTSTGGSMLITFTTDRGVVAAGWSATYISGTVPGGCTNETFTSATGTITDNSGASNYQNNMTCSKLIQPSGGGTITLTFTAFSTEAGYDFVRVYDGSTTSSPLMGTFSGSSLPPTLTSSGGSMLINFTTDRGVVAAGWSATYTSGTVPGGCINETFTTATGTVTDNSGASNYLNYMSCSKLIQPSDGGPITLTFTAFSTEAGYDFVRVYNGSTTSSPLMGTYSGTTLPSALTSTGGSMLITFTTDRGVVAAGWSATYISGTVPGGCNNETFTTATGIVTDNSGTSNYLNYMTCSKLIQPSGGGPITLTFTAFITEAGYDFVRVYNGSTTSSPLMGTYSGTTLPPALTSTGGSMLLTFTTDRGVVAAGWSATYTSGTVPGGCNNETFTTATGIVTDNSGTLNYLNYMSCSKLIQPSGGGPITLTFTAFSTEAGYDFVRVYDGSTTSSPLMGTYSGSSLPPTLTSSGGSMLINFTTDRGIVAAGWSASYTSSSMTITAGKISAQEIPQAHKLVAYPNPTSGILTIESSVKEEGAYTIDLINLSGQVILNQRIEAVNGKFEIEMSDVSPGPYLLKIITNETVEIIRVIKN